MSERTTTIAAAEYLERTFGHRVGLKGYRELAGWTADEGTRARATLGALRCAVGLGEASDVIELARGWKSMRAGAFGDEVIELCKTLALRGHEEAALWLAFAEVERRATPRTVYLYARLLERAGDATALVVYARAAELADKEPDAAPVALAARVRRIERLAMDPRRYPEAAQEAAAANPAHASPAQKLVIAAGLMLSPSRFTRASGLSLLADLGKTARPEIAEISIRMAAAHADRFAESLSAVEADRIAAALKHWPDDAQREAAMARLTQIVRIVAARGDDREQRLASAAEAAPETFPLFCQARAVLSGGGVGAYPSRPEPGGPAARSLALSLASHGLNAVVALRRDKPLDAAASLRAAQAALAEAGGEAPPPLWTGVRMALASRDEAARSAAVALAERMIFPATGAPPPAVARMGRFAALLGQAGQGELAVRALRWAAASRDASASEDLGAELARHGWSAALNGDRDAAVAALREARAIFQQAASGKDAAAKAQGAA